MTSKIQLISLLLLSGLVNLVAAEPKIDCHPLPGASKDKCESLGCTWEPVSSKNKQAASLSFSPAQRISGQPDEKEKEKSRVDEPWCFFPDSYTGYQIREEPNGPAGAWLTLKLTRERDSNLAPNDVHELQLTVEPNERGDIVRIRIYDPNSQRFEPELPEIRAGWQSAAQSASRPEPPKLKARLRQSSGSLRGPGTLELLRTDNNAVIFSTDLEKLIFADKFIQLNSLLSSPFVFGLGEHYDNFLKLAADSYKVYSFYHTDRVASSDRQRSYGSFPFLVNLDSNQTNAHALYLRNSNGMDIVLQSDQSVTFRTIGGIIDLFVFAGPSPLEAVQQYQRLVGLPLQPPRWSLGFHLCRFKYNSLEKTQLVWRRTREAQIPFDVQWNDADYMQDMNDFSYDKQHYAGLPEFVRDQVHANNMHYVMLFDPGLSQEADYGPYKRGLELDCYIKNSTNQILVGKVWNKSGRTVFPDFSNNCSRQLWSDLFQEFHRQVEFDGAWIDMNDISNFVDGSLDGCPLDEPLEQAPYLPGGFSLQHKSLCLSAKHRAGSEYNLHNLYSFYEAKATLEALNKVRPNKRQLIISRSTSPGQGKYGGHWSGDVPSQWNYLQWSIPSLVEHSMYGFSLMGSDICGFSGNTNAQLCARWSTLGAFYTFSRNHNDDWSIDQDPVALGPQVVEANRNALRKRYSLLPYLETLMWRASQFGEPVVRSVSFEFHHQHDPEALGVEFEFMWGRALLISPVVQENNSTKATFLPKGRWYETNILPEYQDDSKLRVPKLIDSTGGSGGWYTSHVGLADLPIFYRGASIVPNYQEARQTTADTVQQPISLDVALCHKGWARGELYIDDGETDDKDNYDLAQIHIDGDSHLNIKMVKDRFKGRVEFGRVKVFGVNFKVEKVQLNQGTSLNFTQKQHMLVFNLNRVALTPAQELDVVWSS